MREKLSLMIAATLAAGASACGENPTGVNQDPEVAAAYNSVLLGWQNTTSSFAGGQDGGLLAWGPQGRHRHREQHQEGPGMGAMMGGGLHGLYLGGGFGPGFGHGRFGQAGYDDACAWDATVERVVCTVEADNGLTVERSFAFLDADGNVQTSFDGVTTDVMNTRIAVTGTATRNNGLTSTVDHLSDRTVTGLAAGSTERTVNGTVAGTEITTGTNDTGDFTVLRVMGDTTKNVVVPLHTGTAPYPVAGTVIRSMQVTLTYAGQAPETSTRREVVTYDGSDTATLVITQDGATKTCSIPLPHGRPICN
ncbi:MAG: hypothetical protein PVH00_07695 [Gemmatimonadota bacterium]|jgi:hypothetical protein